MATIYSNNETINIDPTDDLVLYKEEFINSRIEKFLYAICALDFDDLPTPLSRIEELYKCLATGLPAPTFVPQSRVEKYLMAILGSYDASDLPAPQSRTEVLLNKILMGDTDLSDIAWLKSRYEFLLAYIAKGGEISSGSGNDFEYLQYIFSSSTYSIDRTKELPVKSATLKGNTLVNLFTKTGITMSNPPYLSIKGNMTQIKASTIYTIKYFNLPTEKTKQLRVIERHSSDTVHVIPVSGIGTFTTNSDISNFKSLTVQVIETTSGSISEEELSEVKILLMEGDYTEIDIPYFEGMQSVENPVVTTTGKNLYPYGNIDFTSTYDSWHDSVGTPEMWGDIGSVSKARFFLRKGQYVFSANFDTVENFKGFTLNADDETGIFGYTIGNNDTNKFVVSNDMYVTLRIKLLNKDTHTFMENIQIEEGSVATEYEPYKTTTVTCNEEVELRGIGEVKDELDLLTGKLTRRIDESGNILSQEITESIDISVVDQDGNEAELSSFEDITHVTVTSEGILPDVELSVAKYYPYLTFLLESVSMDTLYNTKELPVKSAILKGDTLVNILNETTYTETSDKNVQYFSSFLTKPNTIYHFIFYVVENTLTYSDGALLRWGNTGYESNQRLCSYAVTKSIDSIPQKGGSFYLQFTSRESFENITSIHSVSRTYLDGITGGNLSLKIVMLEYQEGMENLDIPYFEGMQSVKMPVLTTTGKNLFDGEMVQGYLADSSGLLNAGNSSGISSANFIPVKPNTRYVLSFSANPANGTISYYFYDKYKQFVGRNSSFVTGNNVAYAKFRVFKNTGVLLSDYETVQFQIEEGSVATEYEPYKSTTITCNEEVELHGIGEVKDELDLLTGELTQRVGEIVLNGDESWTYSGYSTPDYPAFYIQIKGSENVLSYTNFICDMFASGNVIDNIAMEGAQMNKSSDSSGANFLVRISGSKLSDKSTAGFNEYIRNNPITVCYTLNTEVGGSANIIIKDQDGNEAELSSFEDITHVTVTSEGILPDVELSVANQFEEDLTTLSLRMNNIATTQEGLEESVDEQTMEVDSTMMATTEIYEGLL